ncbi:MAG TPA: ATP-binding protein, partial [Caldimonas sp.]
MATDSATLDDVLITGDLAVRPRRAPDHEAENRALSALAEQLATDPAGVLQKVAELVLTLCRAGSAGVSILEPGAGRGVFRWHATAGAFAAHLGGTLSRDASPCGVVIDRKEVLLFNHPARFFPELRGVEPRVEEALLAPWRAHGEVIGTVWAVGHTPERRFDAEDARLLQSLAGFAALGYQRVTTLVQVKTAQAGLEQRTHALHDAHEALAAGEARLRVALGAARMGTWRREIALDRQILDESLQRLLGVEGKETMTFEQFLELAHPDDRSRVEEAFTRSIRTGERLRVEFRVPRPDGRTIWLKDEGEVFHGPGGDPLFVSGACVDITELKEAETALNEADRRKDEFIATLAHELRNPLTPLANGLELVRNPDVDEPARHRTFDIMERQLNHLVRLVDDLLDVARITAGKIKLFPARIALVDVVEEAIEATRPALDKRGHRLEVDYASDRDLHVEGDRQRLTQVFGNLLSNAAKYTQRDGRISVRIQREDDSAVVQVADSGLGIPAEALPHVFDLFSQVRAHQRQAEGGLGIGLSLVRSLVEMHGGQVSAHSRGSGTGSTFTVRLPLSRSGHTRPEATVEAQASRTIGRLRVLVADDNEDAAATLAMLIEAQGHQVDIAHDGEEAVQKAQQLGPDVAFLDIGMPRMNGLDAARRLRQLREVKPMLIVAITGWGQPHDRQRTLEAGFDAHLVKPPKLKDVSQVLA